MKPALLPDRCGYKSLQQDFEDFTRIADMAAKKGYANLERMARAYAQIARARLDKERKNQ